MATPIASASVLVGAGLTPILQTPIKDPAYLIIRVVGPNPAVVEIAFSSDGGVNFQIWPDPALSDPTVMVSGAAPAPWELPSPLRRGEILRVRGSGSTTIAVEVYQPEPVRYFTRGVHV